MAYPNPCPNCGKVIPAARGPLAKFCSPTCRGTHWARHVHKIIQRRVRRQKSHPASGKVGA